MKIKIYIDPRAQIKGSQQDKELMLNLIDVLEAIEYESKEQVEKLAALKTMDVFHIKYLP